MRKLTKTLFLFFFAFFMIGLYVPLNADGCYLCGSGSSPNCKDYCRYSGKDTQENRKKCEQAGCRISGTSSCPQAANYKVCNAFGEGNYLERIAHFYKVNLFR